MNLPTAHITSLLIKTREEVVKNLMEKGHAELVGDWLDQSVFKFESEIGKAIANRLKHLSDSVLVTLAEWDRAEVREYAIGLVAPLKHEQKEIEKLVDYIYQLATEK